MSTCRSCLAPVRWVTTRGGRRMPLDPEPVMGGNVLVFDVRHEGTSLEAWVVEVVQPGDRRLTPDRLTYLSHFATCPEAGRHRRRRRGAGEEGE